MVCLLKSLAVVLNIFRYCAHHVTHHPLEYVDHQPSPRQQCFWVGVYCAGFCAILVLFSYQHVLKLNFSFSIFLVYVFLILLSLGHSVTYFDLVKTTGAVSTVHSLPLSFLPYVLSLLIGRTAESPSHSRLPHLACRILFSRYKSMLYSFQRSIHICCRSRCLGLCLLYFQTSQRACLGYCSGSL
jgi:hypothetical protein